MADRLSSQHFELLCVTLGIDASGEKLVVVSQLMNYSLQCLGAVRLICEQIEREKQARQVRMADSMSEICSPAWWSMKWSFANAVKRFIRQIKLSAEPHNLDPARHNLESFPNNRTMGKPGWLAAHWAALGDPCEHAFNTEDLSPNDQDDTNVPCVDSHIDTATEEKIIDTVDKRVLALSSIGELLPECFQETDKEGRSILHIVARLDSVPLLETALAKCKQYHGKTISDGNDNGALPLHNTARFCNSLPVFDRVYEEYTAAVLKKNNNNMLPLHWAAAKSRSVPIMKRLLDLSPDGIRLADAEGYLPLHLAGQNACLDVVRVIYAADPDAIQWKDNEEGPPVFHAAANKNNLPVLEFMTEKYPEALYGVQQRQLTALHLAASHSDDPRIFRYLLQHMQWRNAPSPVTRKDEDNWTAIDCLLHPDTIESRLSFNLLASLQLLSRAAFDVHPETLGRLLANRDNLTRTVLTVNPALNPSLFRELNWQARRKAMWLLCRLGHSTRPQLEPQLLMKALRRQRLEESIVCTVPAPTLNESFLQALDKKSQQDFVQVMVLQRLCRQFLGDDQISIPSGILQKIVCML